MSTRILMVGTDPVDCYVRLAIDLDVMTPEVAAEIHEFHRNASARLQQANGDVVVAVALLAAPILLAALIEGYNSKGALDVLHGLDEGWPEKTGITIVESEEPDLSWETMTVFDDSEGGR